MNKLNISCALKIFNELTYKDSLELKKLVEEPLWIVKDTDEWIHKFYLIKAANQEKLIDKMIENGLPYHAEQLHLYQFSNNCHVCTALKTSKNLRDSTVLKIVILNYKVDPNDFQNKYNSYCLLCDSFYCEHIENWPTTCVKKTDLTTDNLRKIVKNMIKINIYEINKIAFDNNDIFEFC